MFEALNNNKTTVREGVDTDGMDFVALKEFVGKEIHVDGFFFNTGKYGEQVVVVGNGCLINMPARAVETFKVIKDTPEMLEAVLNGHLMLKNLKMVDTKNGTTVAYTLADC